MTTPVSGALSFLNLEALWIAAGGDPAYAPTMAAVAYGESGGVPVNTQKGQPAATTGWGLWQITPGDASLNDPMANAKAAVAKFNGAKAAGESPMQPWGGGTTDPIGQISINQGGPLSLAQAETLATSVHGQKIDFSGAVDTLKNVTGYSNTQWTTWANTLLNANQWPGASGSGTNNSGFAGDLGSAAKGVPGVDTTINAVSDFVQTTESVGNFLGDLTNPAVWKRVGMGALGIFLIIIGGVIFFKGTASGQKLTSEATAAAMTA
jgi:hypothetical protein